MSVDSPKRPNSSEGPTRVEEQVKATRDGITTRIFNVCSNVGQAGGRVLGEAAVGTATFVAKTTYGFVQGILGIKGRTH